MNENFGSAGTLPIYLRASIVEPILQACSKEAPFISIYKNTKSLEDISEHLVRKYLYHLINGNFLRYEGHKKIFVLLPSGMELLVVIYAQIQQNPTYHKDLRIKVE
ncbi:hypothetical protein [Candidatus Nitrosocosmicus franklandus]|uniref:ArnR1-like winged helix-turn-helix domain-containing protein n=1 Tax=Candidatus Nitrosocosmicus franklandianus TaxID=1798806 RepID=A0A484I726_9ARCH|nr:hypothetical protein [Candidatus Nitrosocosmicus franklandus]VFJ12599.1 conserved protein of unknown function [Candidatus Nitrosocosmicus franklandus]